MAGGENFWVSEVRAVKNEPSTFRTSARSCGKGRIDGMQIHIDIDFNKRHVAVNCNELICNKLHRLSAIVEKDTSLEI